MKRGRWGKAQEVRKLEKASTELTEKMTFLFKSRESLHKI